MPSLAEPTERLPYEVPLTLDPLDMADFTKLKNKDLEGFSLDGKPGEMEQVMEELWEKFMEQSRFNLTDLDEEQHKKMDRCFDDFVTAYYDPNRDPRACPSMFDEVSCWPETSPGTLRTIECFTVFKDIMYDNVGKNATLDCFQNGLWSKKANYTDCLNFVGNNSSKDTSTVNTITTIFYVGNSLSLVAVLLALWIFISFKDLRCLRNTIHTNLLFTYLFHNFCWIVYAFVQSPVESPKTQLDHQHEQVTSRVTQDTDHQHEQVTSRVTQDTDHQHEQQSPVESPRTQIINMNNSHQEASDNGLKFTLSVPTFSTSLTAAGCTQTSNYAYHFFPSLVSLPDSYGRRLFGSKRESLCSEVTTMTTFVANGYNPVSTQTGPVLPLQQQQPLLQQPQQQPIQQQQLASSSHLNFRNSTAGLIQNCGDQDGKPTVRDSLL
nr:uncharacterized protein LOC128689542 [Cherax quadricarinatus]